MEASADLSAFESAYRADGPYVAAVLGRLAVPSEAVGDAVQDVFVAAYRRWDDFDRSRPVRPWLTGFARRVAFRYRRSEARRSRKGAALRLVSPTEERPPSHTVIARDFLERFLNQLDDGHRRAFLLAEVEGHGAAEVAQMLQVSTEAVYGRVRTVRRRLREALLIDAREPDARSAGLVPGWGLMAERLASAGSVATLVGTTVGSAVALKVFAATLATGALLLTATAAIFERAAEAPSVQAPRADRDSIAAKVSPGPDTPARAVVVASVEPPDASAPPPARAVAVEPRRTAAAQVASQPAPAEAPQGLAVETSLLRAAKRSIEAGAPAAALLVLDEHARRFPNGQLADARRRSRIRVLCNLGRKEQARGEALALAQARPQDPLAQQAIEICSRPPIQNGMPAEKGE